MGICDDSCDCLVEGTRGLRADGIGTAGDPFTVTPDDDRWIGRTVDTYTDLPTLDASEAGQMALVQDTGLVYAWTVSGTALESGWQVVGPPDWGELVQASVSLPAFGTPVFSSSLALRPGRWDLVASGYIDAVCTAGAYLAVAIDLIDVPTLTIYDQKIVSVWNDSGVDDSRAACFSLQHVKSSGVGSTSPANTDKTIALRATRLSADVSVGDIVAIKIRAVRVASHFAF